jgi:hypothetical protein
MILDDLTRALLRLVDAQNELLELLANKSIYTNAPPLMRAIAACRRDVEALTR